MPWSEWIQGADEDRLAFRRMVASLPHIVSDFDNVVLSRVNAYWTPVQYRGGLPSLQALPAEMFPLTEGVDYGPIPGSDPLDPFRFVEYEGPAYQYIGWAWPNGDPYISHQAGAITPGTLKMLTPSAVPDGYPSGAIDGFSTNPGGTTFASFTGAEGVGAGLGTPPNPGPVDRFVINAVLDADPGVFNELDITIPRDPVVTVRPPRFRYWIPTLAPLRLMQRGDGLGMGSSRLFGPGTRQGSTRIFGSL